MIRALMITAAGLCVLLSACGVKEIPPETTSEPPTPIAVESIPSPQEQSISPVAPSDDPFGANVPLTGAEPSVPPTGDADLGPPSEAPEGVSEESGSSRKTIESVARVIRGTIGADDDEEGESKGSIFRSIGRALTKGAQKAATSSDEAESSEE